MRSYIFIVFLYLLSFAYANGQGCDANTAQKSIDSLFQQGQFKSFDSTRFPGHSKELEILKTPLLNKLLPDYCFFKTIFYTNYYEYMTVQTVVALANNKTKQSKAIYSPTFTKESQSFIQLFYGITLPDTSQCVTLAKEITGMLSDITYEGHFNRLLNLKEKSVISFELWHSDLSWRIYDFYFDTTNKLTNINIKGGVKRQEMLEDYKRQ